jgi:hypothetical protein
MTFSISTTMFGHCLDNGESKRGAGGTPTQALKFITFAEKR